MESTRVLAALAVGLLPATAALAEPAAAACDLALITGSREVHETLSRRAVEVVDRAARSAWRTDDRLVELVAPSAAFSSGSGDLGLPLGPGVAGARKLALDLQADTFRFLGWDFMNYPTDPCAEHKIPVEFVDTARQRVARVEFTFDAGRVVAAKGWSHSFETGAITPISGED